MEHTVDHSIDDSSSTLSAFKHRHLLAQIGDQSLAFPAQWIAEIILIERSLILSLPFYTPLVLGVVHHQGVIIPIIAGHLLLSNKINQNVRLEALKETLPVIRLSQSAQHLSGIGITVDRIINQSADHNASPSATGQPVTEQPDSAIFQLTDLPDHIWQPL
jgi:chemotaxis signal transduction protein